jgi:hypothetical protein
MENIFLMYINLPNLLHTFPPKKFQHRLSSRARMPEIKLNIQQLRFLNLNLASVLGILIIPPSALGDRSKEPFSD